MDLAEDLAGMTDSMEPPVKNKTVVVMAADHGIAEDGVSKYPREVTGQMIYNFVEKKGAGINALARCVNADVVVVDMGVAADISTLVEERKIISKSVRQGTDNIATGPAMSRPEAVSSVEAGIEVANELSPSTDIFGTGDMGIGNTTPAQR
jgi:nicotinate-nucleotide--dimethylbenzimidazole phosphoribosyltransferase